MYGHLPALKLLFFLENICSDVQLYVMQFHYNTSIGFQMVEDSLVQVPIKKGILATSVLIWM